MYVKVLFRIIIYTNERGYEDNKEMNYEYGITTYGRTKDLCKKSEKIGLELGKGLEYFIHKEKTED